MNQKYFDLKKSSLILLLTFIIGIANNSTVLCCDKDHVAIESNCCHDNFIDDVKDSSLKQKSCIDIPLLTTFDLRPNNSAKNLLKEQSLTKAYRWINNSDVISPCSPAVSCLRILYSDTILDSLNTVILLI